MESDHVTVAYETSERSSASVFVAKQMAKYKDTSPEELTPLAEVIDADAIERMGNSAILVNTARGAVIDHDALVDALDLAR